MIQPLKVLIVHQSIHDAEGLVEELRSAGYEPEWQRVDTEESYLGRLQSGLDLVISDYLTPQLSGLRALELLKLGGLDIPFIVVSGTVGEDSAVTAMRQGATDYLVKSRMERLGQSVSQALESSRLRVARRIIEQRMLLQSTALETVENAVVITNAAGIILWVNPAFTVLTGYSSEEAVGNTPRLLKSGKHDREFYEKFWAILLAGKTWRGFLTNRRKDGLLYDTAQTITPVRSKEGSVTHFVAVMEDMTESRIAENALREKQAFFEALANSSVNGVLVVNPKGRKVFQNQRMIDLFKIPPLVADDPDDRKQIEFLATLVKNPEQFDEQIRHLYAHPEEVSRDEIELNDGTVLDRSSAPVMALNGRTYGRVWSFYDITGWRQAERALRDSERFVRSALDALTSHIAILNEKGDILAVNEAWRAYSRVCGKEWACEGTVVNYLDICARTHGAGSEDARLVAAAIKEILAGKRMLYEAEYPCHSPTEQSWYVVRITPFSGDGPRRLVVAHENITQRRLQQEELRASEERFRQVVESIHEVFWVRDVKEGRIIYVSPGYDAIWGRSPEKIYESGSEFFDNIHPDDRVFQQRFSREKQIAGTYDETYRIVRPDGTIRWIHSKAFPVRNAAGEVYRIAGVAEDITERRKLADQFRQTQKLESIGTLAGGIAHDFNNVLAAISGYTELAKMETAGNLKATEYLGAILQGTKRATDLVRQILTFSRQHKLERDVIQLRPVVDEALKLLRATIPAIIEFEISTTAAVPNVFADASQIHQIVMNLCTNAAHAMKDRPGRLVVRLGNFDVDSDFAAMNPDFRPGPYVQLSVSDTGCGMSQATLSRIFEPFFTTKAPGEGTGLGLSVVHGIMQSHDGAITVYSNPREGTIFHLYFPACTSREIEVCVNKAAALRGRGERILYVDDETMLATMAKDILERLGYVVDMRTNAAEALAAVRAKPDAYDLVVTDQMMPGMTGTDLAEQLHEIRAELPVILTTGYSLTLTPERVQALGICKLLLKPVQIDELSTAVRGVLDDLKPR